MGAFFLFRSDASIDTDSAARVFREMGFAEPVVEQIGPFVLWQYEKILVNDPRMFREGNASVHATGSLLYKGLDVEESLVALLRDFRAGRIDEWRLSGTGALLFREGERLSLLLDGYHVQNAFYDDRNRVLSSSLHALISALPGRLALDRMAVTEMLVAGTVTPPTTIIRSIRRLAPSDTVNTLLGGVTLLNRNYFGDRPCVSECRRGFNACVSSQLALLHNEMEALTLVGERLGVDIGLSGGYDSRLILALVNHHYSSYQIHTHWKQESDVDFRIAHELAGQLGKSVHKVPNLRVEEMDEDFLFETMREGALFYDAHVVVNYGLMYETRGRRLRTDVLNGHGVSLSGVGGEQYRNVELLLNARYDIDQFIRYNVISSPVPFFRSRTAADEFAGYYRDVLLERLGLYRRSYLTRYDIKRYSNEIWITAGPGIRNNVENKLVHFFSPFITWPVSTAAYDAIAHLGTFGRFHAKMLAMVNPELASLRCAYGHPAIREPFKYKARMKLRSLLETYAKKIYHRHYHRVVYRQGAESPFESVFRKRFPHALALYRGLRDLELGVDLDNLARREQSFYRGVSFALLLDYFGGKIDRVAV